MFDFYLVQKHLLNFFWICSQTCFESTHIRWYSLEDNIMQSISLFNWTVWKINTLFSLTLDAAKCPITRENKGQHFEEEIGL